MAISFCSFASGSSGNCYMVRTDKTTLLIDVGITGKRVLAGLSENSVDPESIDGILITHEHIDHVRSLRMIGKKASNAEVFASAGTLNMISDKVPLDRTHPLPEEGGFLIGDIEVNPFALSHDAADPRGYSFRHEGRQLTIVTDTGYISEEIFDNIRDANMLVLEANHEVNILRMGPYPYSLQQRILSDEGHLSNETAGKCICRMLKEREGEDVPKVELAHLSKENNSPEQAYLTIRNILFDDDLYIDKDVELNVIARDEISPLIEV